MKKFIISIILLFFITPIYSLDLSQCYQLAQQNDPTFKAARAQFYSAWQNLPIARSKILPNVSATANTTRGSNGTNVVAAGTTDSHGYNITVAQDIVNFQDLLTWHAATFAQKSALATYQAAEQNLISRVIGAYADLLQAEENLALVKINQTRAKQILQLTRQFYHSGLRKRVDVSEAQANFKIANHDVFTNEINLHTKQAALEKIILSPAEHLASLKSTAKFISPTPTDVNYWLDLVKDTNPAVLSDHFSALAAHENINIQRAGHLPTLTANAGYGSNHSHNSLVGDTSNKNSNVSLNLNIPIFSGGAVFYQTRQAAYDYQNKLALWQQNYAQQVANIKQYFFATANDLNNLHEDTLALQANQIAFKDTLNSYRSGLSQIFDVIDAHDKLLQAQKNLTDDRFAYINDFINLKLAAGMLSINEIALVNSWLNKTPMSKK